MSRTRRLPLLAVAAVALALVPGIVTAPARADDTTVSYDPLRTGWDPNEANLNAATVQASDYGQLFATQLDGQIYAQPVVAGNTVLVTTENDQVYGLDPISGTVRWSRDIGPAWPASAIGCGDLTPNIGSTATPVYDPATQTAYFTAKVNDGPDPQHPHWYLHALDIATGAERGGFPTTIQGEPTNSPGHPFNAFTAMQRPGLLLLGGVVYAAFASHCDYGPYVGYVVGVNAASGAISTMWSTEAGTSDQMAGIWQGGGGLVSDGPGRIILATGNGISPPPAPGSSPPGALAESVVRLSVNGDGSLSASDFFSPVNNSNLDRDDADLGSGGPMAIPDGYGTTSHPHLLVQTGKDGRVFLLDRDHLGGMGQGPGGTDDVLQTGGPYNGIWGHPAFWGGGSGYVYYVENGGPLRAYTVGADGNGNPSLTAVGTSAGSFGYTSGSPVVTSDGTTAGSALVWVVYCSGSDGSGGQLRAYSATPNSSGVLSLKYSAPIGTASKFSVPATDAGRVYVGTRDGKLLAYGRPVAAALNATPTDFGNVAVGRTKAATAVLSATRDVTITAISAAAPFAAQPPALPVTLHAGGTLNVPVTFSPTLPGPQSGVLAVTADAGTFAFDVHGNATKRGIAATPAALDYGDVPVTGTVTRSVNITNTSTASETVTSTARSTAPFATSGLPAAGTVIAAGASVSVSVAFTPTATGPAGSSFRVTTNTGRAVVPLSGNGVAGAAHLTITPTATSYGTVPVGQSVTKSFDIANTGNLLLTITKAAPPAGEFGTTTPISEGQQLEPGQVIHQAVTFTPTATGPATGTYLITGNDGQGEQAVQFTGRGSDPLVSLPAPSAGGWQLNGSAVQSGGDTVLTDTGGSEAGDAVYTTAINPIGVHAHFTAQISGGSGADGMSFALLDASATTPSSVGNSGGSLAFAGLTGVAVTLDTYQNGGDPSANFTGIGVANGDPNAAQVGYVATRTINKSLRKGTHTVDVTVAAGQLTAVIDATITIRAQVTIPPLAYLAFTAGTGGLTDYHTVRDVTITRPPATGHIVAAAGTCLTRGTVATVRTCGTVGTQTWVVQANGSVTSGGTCLAPQNTSVGAPVGTVTCDGTTAQQWTPSTGGALVNPASGLCLAGGSGGKSALATCTTGAPEQSWRLPN